MFMILSPICVYLRHLRLECGLEPCLLDFRLKPQDHRRLI